MFIREGFKQAQYFQNTILITFIANPVLITEEAFKASYALMLLSLEVAEKEKPTLIKRVFDSLDDNIKNTLRKYGGLQKIIEKYGKDKNFWRSIICLDAFQEGICAGHAAVDLVKKLERQNGWIEKEDDLLRIMQWNFYQEPISDELILSLKTGFNSLVFSFDLQSNLISEEEVKFYRQNKDVSEPENDRYIAEIERLRYFHLNRLFSGLGFISKNSLNKLLNDLLIYKQPFGILIGAEKHAVNIVKTANGFISADSGGDECFIDMNDRDLSGLVDYIYSCFLDSHKQNTLLMVSIKAYSLVSDNGNIFFDINDYFIAKDKLGQKAKIKFSERIHCELAYDPLSLITQVDRLAKQYSGLLNAALIENKEYIDIFSIKVGTIYIKNFFERLFLTNRSRYGAENLTGLYEIQLEIAEQALLESTEAKFQIFLAVMKQWSKEAPSAYALYCTAVTNAIGSMEQEASNRLLSLVALIPGKKEVTHSKRPIDEAAKGESQLKKSKLENTMGKEIFSVHEMSQTPPPPIVPILSSDGKSVASFSFTFFQEPGYTQAQKNLENSEKNEYSKNLLSNYKN
ncbi:MAG: hypothetical protein V4471_07355 [Pseudomonadota bacterium]